ncbi:MAG: MBL fold metallo-hydrolase [Pseudolabrys sp.]|nr:MBL fold metallo-hydrolase [Pseudolabrys sp.]
MSAPMSGEKQPTVFRFKFGAFEVATLLDSKGIRDNLHPLFGANTTADEVQSLARANNIDPQRLENGNVPTLVNTGKELVLFDTGNGFLPRDYEQLKARMPAGHLVERLAELGHKPEDIDVIVITHGHPDHIGGLLDGGKPIYPNARYLFGAAEYDFWLKDENVREARKFNRELFVKICEPLKPKATFIKPGDVVVPGITAVDAFGHSPGLLAFQVESDDKKLMITADTFTHFVMHVQRPDWHFDMDDDKEKAVVTRKRILAQLASEKMLAIGFHMPFPAIGWIDTAADGTYRWVPYSYQFNL